MSILERYFDQVRLLIDVLPHIAKEDDQPRFFSSLPELGFPATLFC